MAESAQDKSLLKCFYRESTHAYKKSILLVLQGIGILLIVAVILGLIACVWYFGGSSIVGVSAAVFIFIATVFEMIASGFWAIFGFFAGISWKIYTVLLVVLSPAIYAALKCLVKNYPSEVDGVLLLGFCIGFLTAVIGLFVGGLLYGMVWPFMLGVFMTITSAVIRWVFDKDLPQRETNTYYGCDD